MGIAVIYGVLYRGSRCTGNAHTLNLRVSTQNLTSLAERTRIDFDNLPVEGSLYLGRLSKTPVNPTL